MSLSSVESPVCKVLDPRIDVQKERQYLITKGGSKISYIPYKSLSTGSSTMSFNIIPPSRNTFIDRKMYVEATIKVEMSLAVPAATPFTGDLIQPLEDAPRSFPLSRALASATATIGNTNVSMQTSDVIDVLLRCMKTEELKDFNDGCPTALDRSQTYDAYVAASGLNVLGNFSQPLLSTGEYARGYFDVKIDAVDTSVAGLVKQKVEFKVYEPVFLSPFVFSKLNHSSLIGLQNVTLIYNFNSNAELVWSGTQPKFDNGTLASPNVTVSFDNPTCWVSYLSPSPLMEIPKAVNYNYYEVQRFLTNNVSPNALNYGSKTTVNSNNIQLKVIPSLIALGVRRAKGSQHYYQPDCYAHISKVSVNFANSVGLLSTASTHALYNISKKNGLNYNFNEWLGKFGNNFAPAAGSSKPSGTGSLLLLKPSEDFGLGDSEASGVVGAYNFQCSVDIEVIDPSLTGGVTANDYELFTVVINEGEFSIDVAGTGATSTNIGVVTEADVLKAETNSQHDYNSMRGLVGGDFLSTLKNWGEKAASVVHAVAKYAPLVSTGLKSVGMGRGAGRSGGELDGSGSTGGELVGSAIATKRSLKDRLR